MIQVGDDPVCGGFNMLRRISHGDTEPGSLQHWEIVIPITYGDRLCRGDSEFPAQPQQTCAFINAAGGRFKGRKLDTDSFKVQRGQLCISAGTFRRICVIEVDFQDGFTAGGRESKDIRNGRDDFFIQRTVNFHMIMVKTIQMGSLDYIVVRQNDLWHDIDRTGQ